MPVTSGAFTGLRNSGLPVQFTPYLLGILHCVLTCVRTAFRMTRGCTVTPESSFHTRTSRYALGCLSRQVAEEKFKSGNSVTGTALNPLANGKPFGVRH